MVTPAHASPASAGLAKCPTGLPGLDDITAGGLPRDRPTLVCDGACSGKTLLAQERLDTAADRQSVAHRRQADQPAAETSR
jgi:RecA/RadA recombinase